MNTRRRQLALREWRQHLLHPLTPTALAAVTAVLALAGPFGTHLHLSLPERVAYWGVLVIWGYVSGYLISDALLRTDDRAIVRFFRVGIAGVLTGLIMSIAVVALNRAIFGFFPSLQGVPTLLGTVIAIAIIVVAVIDLFVRHLGDTSPELPKGNLSPPLLDRLPFDKRGGLVALSVEDHYVRVHTSEGDHMLLMRLTDAIREVGSTVGERVHRSYWAAFDQVDRVERHGDRATLHMRTGIEVPVSRANLPKLKEAGLLP